MEATTEMFPGTIIHPSFKIILDGAAGVGKTAFINRHKYETFKKTYSPTQGVNVTVLTFSTSIGQITFKVWDLAGDERYRGLGEGYYVDAKGLIAMYDLSDHTNVTKNAALRAIQGHPDLVPVLCGNKVDTLAMDDIWQSPPGLPYYEVSAKTDRNCKTPFLVLARALTNTPDLTFIEKPRTQLIAANKQSCQAIRPGDDESQMLRYTLGRSTGDYLGALTGAISKDLEDWIINPENEGQTVMVFVSVVITNT
jgi:GTP-binding nuclear protein Ran